MKVRKFQGSSSREALNKAALMYGEDIVLIETKLVREGNKGQSAVYEILVGIEEEVKPPQQNRTPYDRQQEFPVVEEKLPSAQNIQRKRDGSFDLKIDTFEDSTGMNLANSRPEKQSIQTTQSRVQKRSPYGNSSGLSDNSLNRKKGFELKEDTPPSPPPQKPKPRVQQRKEEIFLDVSETARKISELAQKRQQESIQQCREREEVISEVQDQFIEIEKQEKKIVKSSDAKTKVNGSGSNNDMFKEIKSEISQLNDKIKLIQNMFWNEKSPTDISTTIPPEFSEIYRIAKNSGMKREHLEMLMKLSIQHMPFKMRHNSETVKRYFKVVLRKMIPTRAETFVQAPNRKIIMLVGPTGVGKTTTIAKLTARFALKSNRNYRVGLIVLDSYKIGAVEQLTQYARMMKVSIESVVSPDEFMEKLERMSNYDYIFIDTMGSSPYDLKKIEQMQYFLQSNHLQQSIDVMLVVPSSLKYEDLKQSYDSFSRLNIDTIMFTKLDETKGFGNIFSLVHEIQKPISYFSVGQEVPEDIVVATSDYLVDSLLNGFKRERDE